MDDTTDSEDTIRKNEIVAFIEKFDQTQLLNGVAALQLSSKNQGKEVRLEMLVHEILKNGQPRDILLSYEEFKDFFADHFVEDYMEDPTVSFFTENIVFFGGNYRIYPGINPDASEKLNGLLEAIFTTPNELSNSFKLRVQQATYLLLIISESMAVQSGIKRYELDESEDEQIFIPEYDEFNNYSRAVKFEKKFIKEVCYKYKIPEDTINNFLVTSVQLPEEYDPYDSILINKPFVDLDENYICLIPATISKSLCDYIKQIGEDLNESPELSRAFHVWQESKILDYAEQMGWSQTALKLPNSPAEKKLIENVFQFDQNKLAYVCLIKGASQEDNEPVGAKEDTIYERISNVTAFLNSKNEGNTRVLTLFISGGYEDQMMIAWPKPTVSNYNLVFSFSDFEKIMFSGELEPLLLWKFAKAHNQAVGVSEFSFGSSTLDMYGYYKDNGGSLLPPEQAPGYMVLMGAGTDFQRGIIKFRDEHGSIRIINEKLVEIPVRRARKYAPIYKEQRRSPHNNLLIESYQFPLWVLSDQAKSRTDFNQIAIYIEAAVFWLYRLTSSIAAHLNCLGTIPVEIRIELDRKIIDEKNPEVWANAGEFSGELDFIVEARNITVDIPFSIVTFFIQKNNSGEKILIKTLLKAFNIILRKAKCEQLTEDFINEVVETTLSPNKAKMILFANSGDNPLLDTSDLPSVRYLKDTDKELIADHLVEMLKLPNPFPESITDPVEQNKLCLKIVGTLLNKIQEKLKYFDAGAILKWMMLVNERLTYQAEYNSLLLPHKIACFSNFPSEVDDVKKKDSDIVPTAVAVRGIIELIVADPIHGTQPINLDDMDEIIALMSEVIYWANLADSIVLLANTPVIGRLPSGRIGVKDTFYEDFIAPFNNSRAETEVYHSINQSKSYDFDEGNVLVNNAETDAAFLEEWGTSLTTITAIYGSLTHLGMQEHKSFMMMEEIEFLSEIQKLFAKPVSEDELRKAIDLLSIDKRKSVSKAPEGYIDKDILPWRYNRALSYVRRPLIKIHYPGNEKPTYHWGFRHALRSYMQLTSLITTGKLKVKEKGPIEGKVISIFVKQNGKQYRDQVFNWFKEQPDLRVIDNEVTIDVDGHLIADKNYGDIDVMVIDDSNKIIYSIECKNTASARVIHEMKTELDSYIGQDGDGGHILKHLNRHNWVIEHIDLLTKFVDQPKEYTFKSLVLTSNVIPAIYLAKNKAALPIYSFQDLIRKGFEFITSTIDQR